MQVKKCKNWGDNGCIHWKQPNDCFMCKNRIIAPRPEPPKSYGIK